MSAPSGIERPPILGMHHGALDKTMVTTGAPPEAMQRVLAALETMGITVEAEHEYLYRCTRPRRGDIAEVDENENENENEKEDSRIEISRPTSSRLPYPTSPREGSVGLFKDFTAEFITSNHNGITMQPTPVHNITITADPTSQSSSNFSLTDTRPSLAAPAPPGLTPSPLLSSLSPSVCPPILHGASTPITTQGIQDIVIKPTSTASSSTSDVILIHAPARADSTIYGARIEDSAEEVRFTVELTRLNRLEQTYTVDIRRLKGNLRSYKFLYDTLRDRADLQRPS
ncbi:hypothetical protein H0H87_002491 [Tephrocybe sp. NHM501043]|nr:hypothetical protein H0H87_002491 [Tephrocybe sp. NHM501043]